MASHELIKISVVSPVYRCRECLETLVDKVAAVFAETNFVWELILVDDRGPDQPWDLVSKLARDDPRVRGIRLARNHGQHLAIWAGFEAATGDYVAVMDCDLQDDPSIIPALLGKLKNEKVDAVVVDRGAWSDSSLRRFSSRAFYFIIKVLTGVQLKNVGNFGLYSRRLMKALLLYQEQEVFLPIMVSLTGLPIAQFQLDRSQRLAGDSAYSFRRLLSLSIAIIIRFTDRPLKMSVVLGLLFSSLSGLISICLFVLWLMGAFSVPGWTSTILSLWFLSGLIMATLGIHGFYLGKVFKEVQKRPRILVDITTDDINSAL
ncbi:MAG: glycosyltransferase family 2 protein [Pseudomonadota bacterium]